MRRREHSAERRPAATPVIRPCGDEQDETVQMEWRMGCIVRRVGGDAGVLGKATWAERLPERDWLDGRFGCGHRALCYVCEGCALPAPHVRRDTLENSLSMNGNTARKNLVPPEVAPTPGPGQQTGLAVIKDAIQRKDPRFFSLLRDQTVAARSCDEVLLLSSLRKKAAQKGLAPEQQILRIAIVGGYTLYPLHEIIGHFLSTARFPVSIRADFLLENTIATSRKS